MANELARSILPYGINAFPMLIRTLHPPSAAIPVYTCYRRWRSSPPRNDEERKQFAVDVYNTCEYVTAVHDSMLSGLNMDETKEVNEPDETLLQMMNDTEIWSVAPVVVNARSDPTVHRVTERLDFDELCRRLKINPVSF